MPVTMKTSAMRYKDDDGNMQDVGLPVGGVVTDSSLTKRGVPADAKAVGDAIKNGGGGTGLPEVTEADNGKVLQVVDGVWGAVEVVDGNTVLFYADGNEVDF